MIRSKKIKLIILGELLKAEVDKKWITVEIRDGKTYSGTPSGIELHNDIDGQMFNLLSYEGAGDGITLFIKDVRSISKVSRVTYSDTSEVKECE